MATALRAITQTLVAATVTDDTITGTHSYIEITNQTSGTVVYVIVVATVNNTVPTVAGNDCFPVLGGTVARLFSKPGSGAGTSSRIRMISAGVPVVTIMGRIHS